MYQTLNFEDDVESMDLLENELISGSEIGWSKKRHLEQLSQRWLSVMNDSIQT